MDITTAVYLVIHERDKVTGRENSCRFQDRDQWPIYMFRSLGEKELENQCIRKNNSTYPKDVHT